MAKFIYVFRGGAIATPGVSPTDVQKHLQKWRDWVGKLAAAGHHVPGGQPLQNEGRVIRGKKKTMTDGPFAESKDMVTGTLGVEFPSLDAAAEAALECPVYEYDGSVEVRGVFGMEA